MAVKRYSLKKDGNKSLSKNFKVKEFRSKCGADEILIDDKLVKLLQKVRDKFGKVSVSSAYRTEKHNAKVGGVPKSQHRYGTASDITLSFSSAKKLLECARYAEKIGFTGIGLDNKYQNFLHLDTREKVSYFRYNSRGGTYSVPSFFNTVQRGMQNDDVKVLQERLTALGFKGNKGEVLSCDGIFGSSTEYALKNCQKANGLTADGVAGPKTWRKIY
jgi:murein L,D-transpeptidase YcbB/YkuD